MRSTSGYVGALLAMALVVVSPGLAVGAPKGSVGTLQLTFTEPNDGTALVEISRVDGAAATWTVVHGSDDAETEMISLPTGTYRITPRVMLVGDQRYVGRSDPMQVRVKADEVTTSTITYTWSQGVQNLRATDVTATSVALAWDAELGDDTTVWRIEGDAPVTKPGQGTEVAVADSSITDTGLAPGTTYSYAVFARPGDGAFGRTDGDPVTITVGTAPGAGTSDQPLFVLNPRTVILAEADITSAVPTGDGVQVTLEPGSRTPVPGAVLSVPILPMLEGGYLGEVVQISDDGRTVRLVPAAMGAAFDLYHVAVSDFSELEAFSQFEVASTDVEGVPERGTARASRSDGHSGVVAASAQGQLMSTTAKAAKTECSVTDGIDVVSDIGLSHGGHADVTIDKHKIFFVEVPSGVSFDVGYTTTLEGSLGIEAGNSAECELKLKSYHRQISVYPVPLALEARPGVRVAASNAATLSDVGFVGTAGFEADGHMSFSGSTSFDGDVISTSAPTQPTATGTSGFTVDIGGSVVFGPGVGSKNAGVVIGLGGDLALVDASVSATAMNDGAATSSCIEISAATGIGMFVALRAWLPGYSRELKVPIEPLQGTFPWGASPWQWPDECTEGEVPTNDVVGDGVSVINDDVTGSSDQWGKVDGFVPGESTWVLSTGRIHEAVGTPSFFASTDLAGPGEAALSSLAGFPTYDAAAFSVTVVPDGHTLNVRYAFASEEYPEYVGSTFNDVMAVLVNGQNCAFVPGSQTPVAVNTINAGSHAQYYVDNSAGAAGYGTTMDGLTKPLTCSVPVTPGQPVTVRIAVADTSDGIYDSAVALLDGGIWSE